MFQALLINLIDIYLYHAYVELRGEDGEILEIIPYDIGFRRLEMIDKVIYLNGNRLVITGVNRHEWSAKTGRSISMDEMTADIDCMIRNNINAVRTCHSRNLVRLNHRAAYLVLFRNGGRLLLTGLGVILKLLKTIQQFFSGL